MDYLNQKRELGYRKYINKFELFYGNDVVSLEIEDIKKLIPILQEFVR